MASTTILTSISRSTQYPLLTAVSSTNNKGYISVRPIDWTKQMLCELPSIKFTIYTKLNQTNVKFDPVCIVVPTSQFVNGELQLFTSSESIYNIPNTFYLAVEPLFDPYCIKAHNESVDAGLTNEQLWGDPTNTFNVEINFMTD